MTERAWGPGAATGVGSLPGTDPAEAVRLVLGELPDLPHLPELPARGAGADMVGRGAALLVDLPVDVQPSGWRLVDRPGRDLRRAADLLARDLDALERAADGYAGPLKLQVTGPWTLAATVELHYGDKAVSDPRRDPGPGAVAGRGRAPARRRRRPPGAGRAAGAAGGRAVPAGRAGRAGADGERLRRAVRGRGAARPGRARRGARRGGGRRGRAHRRALLRAAAAARAVPARPAPARSRFDAALVGQAQDDELGTAVEAGVALWLGVVPGTDADLAAARRTPSTACAGCGAGSASLRSGCPRRWS